MEEKQTNESQEKKGATPYDNLKAHELLMNMIALGQKLTITFKIDEYLAYVAEIESRQVSKFNYQFSDGAIYMIINYVFEECFIHDKADPFNPLMEMEGDPPINFQFFMLMVKKGFIPHILPSFIDRPDRITATFKGKNGTIITRFDKTPETEKFLRENELLH